MHSIYLDFKTIYLYTSTVGVSLPDTSFKLRHLNFIAELTTIQLSFVNLNLVYECMLRLTYLYGLTRVN